MNAEDVARLFHETYEELAPQFGYETRTESAVPWSEVPYANQQLMIATCQRVLDGLPTETRFKMADGTLVADEYGYVGELEFFEDCDEPVMLIAEKVAVVSSEPYAHFAPGALLYLESLAEADPEDSLCGIWGCNAEAVVGRVTRFKLTTLDGTETIFTFPACGDHGEPDPEYEAKIEEALDDARNFGDIGGHHGLRS